MTKQTIPHRSDRNIVYGDLPTTIEKSLQPPVSDSSPPNYPDENKLDLRQRYQQMWHRYSQNVQASTPANLDYLISHKAFEDGHNQKEIGLMLIAGSLYVKQIHQEQGKHQARAYVSQTVRAVCKERQQQQLERKKTRFLEMEI